MAVLLVPMTVGCTHGGGRPSGRRSDPESSASMITRRQVDSLAVRYPNAYDLIRTVRPNMFVTRELREPRPVHDGFVGDPIGVKVFLDDVFVGGTDMLRRIPSRSIIFVQHLSAPDATTRYGSGMTAGVIVITTGATRFR